MKQKVESDRPLSSYPEIPEVALLLWVMLSSQDFKMAKFTLASLEAGLTDPHSNTVLSTIHTMLLTPVQELPEKRKHRKIKVEPEDVGAYEWWTCKLSETIQGMIRHRRKLAYDLAEMEDANDDVYNEEHVMWYKDNIRELDDLLEPILAAPIPKISNDQINNYCRETKKAKQALLDDELQPIFKKCVPFEGPDSYDNLSAEQRLFMLKALCLWRAYGYPETSVLDTLRLFDVDSLRQMPLGVDHLGQRYYYFPQFYRDMRVYREIPSPEVDNSLTEEEAEKKRKKHEADIAAEKKRIVEEEKRKKKEEAETRRLLAESGRRSSSRKRTEPERFDFLQAEMVGKRKKYVDYSSEEDQAPKASSKVKKPKPAAHVRRYFGPEPMPIRWELACESLDELKELIQTLKKANAKANAHLVFELNDVLELMEAEALTIRREVERIRKQEMWQVMPRKRSSRIADAQARQEEEESLRRQEELDRLAAIEEEQRFEEEERTRLEREHRQMDREKQRELDDINRGLREEHREELALAIQQSMNETDPESNITTHGEQAFNEASSNKPCLI